MVKVTEWVARAARSGKEVRRLWFKPHPLLVSIRIRFVLSWSLKFLQEIRLKPDWTLIHGSFTTNYLRSALVRNEFFFQHTWTTNTCYTHKMKCSPLIINCTVKSFIMRNELLWKCTNSRKFSINTLLLTPRNVNNLRSSKLRKKCIINSHTSSCNFQQFLNVSKLRELWIQSTKLCREIDSTLCLCLN